MKLQTTKECRGFDYKFDPPDEGDLYASNKEATERLPCFNYDCEHQPIIGDDCSNAERCEHYITEEPPEGLLEELPDDWENYTTLPPLSVEEERLANEFFDSLYPQGK